ANERHGGSAARRLFNSSLKRRVARPLGVLRPEYCLLPLTGAQIDEQGEAAQPILNLCQGSTSPSRVHPCPLHHSDRRAGRALAGEPVRPALLARERTNPKRIKDPRLSFGT